MSSIMIKTLILITYLSANIVTSTSSLPPQENSIFQHASNIVADQNYWDDVASELSSHGLPTLQPSVLRSAGKAALVDIYHEHEEAESEPEQHDAIPLPEIKFNPLRSPQAMKDVSPQIMSMLSHLFTGPTHSPLPMDVVEDESSVPIRPMLRSSRPVRPMLPFLPPPFFPRTTTPPVPPPPMYKPMMYTSKYKKTTGVPPPSPPPSPPPVIAPHLPLGTPIRHIASHLPLGTAIASETSDGERQMKAIMDQIVDERKEEKKNEQRVKKKQVDPVKVVPVVVSKEKKLTKSGIKDHLENNEAFSASEVMKMLHDKAKNNVAKLLVEKKKEKGNDKKTKNGRKQTTPDFVPI